VWSSGSGDWRDGGSSSAPPPRVRSPRLLEIANRPTDAAPTADGPQAGGGCGWPVLWPLRTDSGGNVDGAGASAGVIPLPPLVATGVGPRLNRRQGGHWPTLVANSSAPAAPPPTVDATLPRHTTADTRPQPPVLAAPPPRAGPPPPPHRPWAGGRGRPPRHPPPFPTRPLAHPTRPGAAARSSRAPCHHVAPPLAATAATGVQAGHPPASGHQRTGCARGSHRAAEPHTPRGPFSPPAVYRAAGGEGGDRASSRRGASRWTTAGRRDGRPPPPPPPPRRPNRLVVATGPARQPRQTGSPRRRHRR